MVTVYLGKSVVSGVVQLWNALVQPVESGVTAPTFSAGSYSISVPENITTVATYAVSSNGGGTVVYSLTGADAARFNINSSTGAVTFVTAPDFEAPNDVGTNNVYNINVVATNSAGSASAAIIITVTDVNESIPPTMPSIANFSIAENTTAVGTVTATGGSAPISYTLTGPDAARFGITVFGGVISANAAFDYENPVDVGANNVYNFSVVATNGAGSATTSVAVTVTDVAEPVAPTLPTTSSFNVNENNTAVGSVTITSGTASTYSLTGADASLFNINQSGVITFIVAPDYESPVDVGANNVYNFNVVATNAAGSASSAVTVTVVDVTETVPVSMLSTASFSVAENTTAVGTVAATGGSTPITYSITGPDAARVQVNSSGVVSFVAAPDFENPADVGANNVYNFNIVGTNSNNSASTAVTVTVTNVAEAVAPTIPATASFNVNENTTAVGQVQITSGTTVVYSLTGEDANRFSITQSGVITFLTPPDFEAPTDVGTNNVYNINVVATNGAGSASSAVTVTVVDAAEAVAVVIPTTAAFSVAENTTAVGTVSATSGSTPITYSLTGVDAARFSVTNAGVLTFVTAPDYESPTDVGANNVYNVNVVATNSVNSAASAVTVTVTDVVEGIAPAMAATASFTVNENNTAVGTVAVSAGSSPIVYSLTGADANRFSVNSSGVVTFLAAPNYEVPLDTGADNVYNFNVVATNGFGNASTAVTTTVVNVFEDTTPDAITFTARTNAAFNTSYFAIAAITGVETGAPLAFSGGEISTNNQVSWTTSSPQNYVPGQTFVKATGTAGGDYGITNNVDVVVNGVTGRFPITTASGPGVTIPGFAANFTFSVAENSTAVGTATASTGTGPIVYSLASTNNDHTKFNINSSTGVITWVTAPDYENPTDAGTNNVYNFSVVGTNSAGSGTATVAVTVTNVVEDSTPNPISFTAVSNAALNTPLVSSIVTIAGLEAGVSLPVSIGNAGEFAVDPGTGTFGPYRTTATTVQLGYRIRLSRNSPETYNATNTTTLTLDNTPYDWTIATGAADTTPAAFTLGTVTNAQVDTDVVSSIVTVTGVSPGIDIPISITGTNATYSINNGLGWGVYTAQNGVVRSGYLVRVKLRSPAELSVVGTPAIATATLDINGETAVFSVQTTVASTNPDPVSLGTVEGAVIGQYAYSNTVTVTGVTAGVDIPISVQNGEIRWQDLNNVWSAWGSSSGQVRLGFKIQARHYPNSALGGRQNTIVRLAGNPLIFRSISAVADRLPDDLVFNAIVGATEDSQQISNRVIITGINENVGVSIVGGEIAVNGGSFGASAVNVAPGSRLELRAQAGSSSGQTRNIKVTVGVAVYNWSITTRAYSTVADSIVITNVSSQPLDTPLTATKLLTGITAGREVTVTNAELSNDGGLTYSGLAKPFVVGQTYIRVTVAGSSTYLTRKSTIYSVNGVSATLSAITVAGPNAPIVALAGASTGAVPPGTARVNRPIFH